MSKQKELSLEEKFELIKDKMEKFNSKANNIRAIVSFSFLALIIGDIASIVYMANSEFVSLLFKCFLGSFNVVALILFFVLGKEFDKINKYFLLEQIHEFGGVFTMYPHIYSKNSNNNIFVFNLYSTSDYFAYRLDSMQFKDFKKCETFENFIFVPKEFLTRNLTFRYGYLSFNEIDLGEYFEFLKKNEEEIIEEADEVLEDVNLEACPPEGDKLEDNNKEDVKEKNS